MDLLGRGRTRLNTTPNVVFINVLGFAQQVLKDAGALGVLDAFYNSSHSYDELLHRST